MSSQKGAYWSLIREAPHGCSALERRSRSRARDFGIYRLCVDAGAQKKYREGPGCPLERPKRRTPAPRRYRPLGRTTEEKTPHARLRQNEWPARAGHLNLAYAHALLRVLGAGPSCVVLPCRRALRNLNSPPARDLARRRLHGDLEDAIVEVGFGGFWDGAFG